MLCNLLSTSKYEEIIFQICVVLVLHLNFWHYHRFPDFAKKSCFGLYLQLIQSDACVLNHVQITTKFIPLLVNVSAIHRDPKNAQGT